MIIKPREMEMNEYCELRATEPVCVILEDKIIDLVNNGDIDKVKEVMEFLDWEPDNYDDFIDSVIEFNLEILTNISLEGIERAHDILSRQ